MCWVEIDMLNKHETGDACLLSDGDNSVWIPKSLMEDWPDKGKEGTAIMKEWIAIEKGLV
jgi:hypothetical protein